MPRRALPPYWVGKKPSDSKRWSGMDSATILEDSALIKAVFHMYRRYVKQWNDIELDRGRSLAEHTQEVLGAKFTGAARHFVFAAHSSSSDRWLLDVRFARAFKTYYPGLSCALNPFRDVNDIQSIRLHWAGTGNEDFHAWLLREQSVNAENGEWTEYKK